MNGASKILTVSYGTFSCTLEGFDDPFNTMKAIAEYFRDLAADDRYFGAEPPTPDAAMLHRIAEREIQRRVEAKVGEHGITLRAGDAVPTVTEPAAAPSPAPSAVQSPVETTAPAPSAAAILAEPAAAPSVASPAEAAPAVESAAARLHRLRAAQAQIQGQLQSQPFSAPVFAPQPVSTQPAPLAFKAAPDAELYAEDQEPAPVAPIPATNDIAAPVEADDDSAVDMVLAALQAEPAAAPASTSEVVDEVEDDVPVLSALRETLAGLEPMDDQLAEDMADQSAPVELTDDFELNRDIEDAPLDVAPVEAASDESTIGNFSEADEAMEIAAETFPQPVSLQDAEPVIDDAAYVDLEEPVAASAEMALVTQDTLVEPETDDAPSVTVSPDAPVVADKLQRARARVIKIRRLDRTEKSPSVLSAEDEADLQNTLAALEAEVAPPTEAAPQALVAEVEDVQVVEAVEIPEDAPVLPPETPASSGMPRATDASVERILAQTNQQLEVPEIKRRRSAIAHLKAAVLATVADRRNNPKAQASESEAKADPYRQDLDKVMRPMTSAPASDRPAPLVLVSAQRIDRKSEAGDLNRPMPQIVSSSPAPMPSSLSVRPRRVTSGGLAQAVSAVLEDDEDFEALAPSVVMDGKQSFAEFADTLGAASLSELLEAAGAYCTLVLDRPSFSRPLLFQQVSQLPTMAETKREDSLRNFGKLLREGRFQKTVRGQFALAETSPILTEAKRIAG